MGWKVCVRLCRWFWKMLLSAVLASLCVDAVGFPRLPQLRDGRAGVAVPCPPRGAFDGRGWRGVMWGRVKRDRRELPWSSVADGMARSICLAELREGGMQ